MTTSFEHLESFKAYDVRGRVPDQLNEPMAELIGRAYADFIGARRVVVGHDVRLTSPALADALCRGLVSAGVEVLNIGEVGTEEVYFACFSLELDGGVMVTASHNPRDYNGMKFTRQQARPISADTGLHQIEQAVIAAMNAGDATQAPAGHGSVRPLDNRPAYINHLLSYVDLARLRPLRIVVNAGNGGAGAILDRLEERLPFELIKLNHEADGSFPNGVPNPLLPENRAATAAAVVASGADLGVAWDGDFDRCFFFDERGEFVEGYYLVGLLAQRALRRHPGAKIVHDPRLVWNTVEMVREAGGVPVLCKSGHAFIKEKMRAVDAAYGGEMSAHQYFKEFSYCDSGMIPWLQVAEAMSVEKRPLSAMVDERIARYPVSGEMNLTLADPAGAITAAKRAYSREAVAVDETDGLSVEFGRWRFNVRMSNTEPVVRVNVETRADKVLLDEKTHELLDFLRHAGGGGDK